MDSVRNVGSSVSEHALHGVQRGRISKSRGGQSNVVAQIERKPSRLATLESKFDALSSMLSSSGVNVAKSSGLSNGMWQCDMC